MKFLGKYLICVVVLLRLDICVESNTVLFKC